jgi:ABC-type transporter Mla subunit MlaD
MTVLPVVVGVLIAVFSYGVKAGDYIEKIEDTSALVEKHNSQIISDNRDISNLKLKEEYLEKNFEETQQSLKEFRAFIIAASSQLSALNANVNATAQIVKEQSEDIKNLIRQK